MRKFALLFVISAFAMIILISTSANTRPARAEDEYGIAHVDHTVEVLYNGYVLVNDTVQISGQISDSFLLGFPNKYGQYVIRCTAYDTQDRSVTFPVSLDVPLEDHMGFYGVKVDFSGGSPQTFTIEFVLSNILIVQDPQNTTSFTLVFPGFPSLTKTAALCNVSIVLPGSAEYTGGTVDAFDYGQADLSAFAYNESVVKFYLPGDEIQLFDIDQLNRKMTINGAGEISGSDSYYITNIAPKTLDFVAVVLPPNASNPSAQDQFGRTLSQPTLLEANSARYKVVFALQVETGRQSRFTVNYDLAEEAYVNGPEQAGGLSLNVSFFQNVNYFINQASVTVALPDGAKVVGLTTGSSDRSYGIERNVFQETATVTGTNLIYLDAFNIGVLYQYNPLWSGLGPTLWVWASLIVASTVVAVWRRPKAAVKVVVPSGVVTLRPEFLKSFVESYEEKMKIASEIDSLEGRARRGRIQRRRYKVQRRTFEARLNTLSRNLEELKDKLRSAGGHYSSLMRQLEVAETEMNEVETNLRSIEARHRRGELSLEGYRKLLADYQRRKEKTETTIDGILLRLREEIR
jgi:hypothetical protein